VNITNRGASAAGEVWPTRRGSSSLIKANLLADGFELCGQNILCRDSRATD
jgi:hypothetical protein